MQWTDKQLDVINTRGRNILVSAAAGSGKTAVLVERIIRMVTDSDCPTDIDQLLVVTFTRAAASEMRERIRERLEKLAEKNPGDVNIQKQLSFIHNARITTIDSFCASVVRENFDRIDLDPNYRIADETEIEMLKSDVMEDMLEEYYEKSEPEFIHLAEQYSSGKLSDNISELMNLLYKHASGHYNPEKWIERCVDSYNILSVEELESSEWMQMLLANLRKQMEGWIDNLNVAISISESADGPKVGEKLQQMIELIECVKNSDTYDGMRNAILNIGTITLRAVKDCDETKKQQVSSIKKNVADSIKKMREDYFYQDMDAMFEDMKGARSSVEMIVKLTLDFMERFQREKSEKGIIDFSDQAHYALNILNDEDENGDLIPSETARQMALQFREIMIDEYQDSNYIQEAILSSVAGGYGCGNMFMVGDVKQSIYRFRQAEPKLFLGKYDTYPEDLNADNCKIILDKNFRSRKEVIDSVNFIFDFIMHRQVGGIDYKNGNQLELGADYDNPPQNQDNRAEFIMIEGDEKKIEAEYVAQKIREITDPVCGMKITEKGGMRPVRYGDIAILLRSMKGVSEIYQEQLDNNGVPAFAETKTGYYQAMEVRTLLSMLSIIDNPRQDIPLAAVMVSPMFGFSSDELAQIKAENICECLYDHVETYGETGRDETLKCKVTEFLEMLNKFRDLVPYTSVYEIINSILAETGYDYYIKAMVNGKKRYLNIQALKEKAAAYDQISYKGLFNFIRYVEKLQYMAKDDGEASSVSENDNIVHIMSIHKSKGLQFPVVFVCNTAAGAKNDTDKVVADDKGNIGIDYIDSQLKVKSPTILKKAIKLKNKEEDVAERLRILYVALTRAKEKLFITGMAKDVEKTALDFANSRYEKNEFMSYNQLVGGKNLMEWIGKTIGKNKAFVDITGEYEFDPELKNNMYDRECNVKVKTVFPDEIIFTGVQEEMTDEIRRETLRLLESPSIVDDDTRELLNGYFAYEYPFRQDIMLHSKASVTEIKKQSMAYEEEQDGFAMYGETPEAGHKKIKVINNADNQEAELPEIIPGFAGNGEQRLSSAQRGTAYHRVFELLDMNMKVYSEKSIRQMIEGFVDSGMMDRTDADSVDMKDVVRFTETDLFRRMREAHSKGKLFREQKFLMGVPAKEIYSNSSSEEMMIIQGIIDVCFIENGKYVIADYKTDRVRHLEELEERYHVQLECYKKAIQQISNQDVSEMIIYSVTLGAEKTIENKEA